MRQKKIHNYTVKFTPNDIGGWLVQVPAIPEVQTEGRTFLEAQKMAEDAILLCLKVRLEDGEPIPKDVYYKAVEEPKFLKLAVAV